MMVSMQERAVLADGNVALVRTLYPADAPDVLALHTRLTERDRYFRFFGPGPSTLDKIATRIAAESGSAHGAVGCFVRSALVGVANFELLPGSADAEIALVVDGDAQAHGVATLLLEYLVSIARHEGIRRFVAEVLAENSKMIRVFADLGLPFEASVSGPEREVTLLLDQTDTYLDAIGHRDLVADTASLGHLFRPSSVAVIGAGRRPGSVGHAVLMNLLDGGYTGKIQTVNPSAEQILGVRCAHSVSELPETPELAVICLPADAAVSAVEDCGRRGVSAVVVISSGLTGTDAGVRARDAVRRFGMRMVGPNCLGVATTEPGHTLNATFLRDPVPPGNVGIVTQSGGVGIAFAESLANLGLGISNFVSTGDKYDVSGNDMLLWWMGDTRTELAVLYLESFGNPRKFGRLARTLARSKPVLAVRAGSGEIAQAAAASHTAAAATPAVTRDALYEQAGVIAVDTVHRSDRRSLLTPRPADRRRRGSDAGRVAFIGRAVGGGARSHVRA
jgi:succinyl-CoA synthetase alpha subunit/GNAT superfamily N-acetyltransferase